MATPGVDFFRVDRSSRTRWLLVLAGVLVTLGATSLGAHLVRRLGALAQIVSLAGGALLLLGLVVGFGTMASMLFENVYVCLEDAGLVVHQNGQEMVVAWEALEGVDAEAETGRLVLRRAAGEPMTFFAGDGAEAVATAIQEAKRKAAHGLPVRASTAARAPRSGA